jgi:type II secretory pathway pseudopilin PulG
MRFGYTLIELVLVLVVSAFGLSLLVPTARVRADRLAAVGAREALIGLVASARSRALARGGSALILDEATASAWLEADGSVTDSVALGGDFDVEVSLLGSRTRATLRFDALGIGRVASQSVLFRRGRSDARVVVSSYGGVSRR